MVLLRNRPSQVADAIGVSHATMATIRQNLFWAFGYNLVGVPIAAGALRCYILACLYHFKANLQPGQTGLDACLHGSALCTRHVGCKHTDHEGSALKLHKYINISK